MDDDDEAGLTAVNLNVLPNLWIPDIEILDLMSFQTHKVLSTLEGRYTIFHSYRDYVKAWKIQIHAREKIKVLRGKNAFRCNT